MSVLPLWAIGKHWTVCVITPQTLNATSGALTDVTGYTTIGSMFGHLDSIEVAQEVDSENISAMDSTAKNMVPVEYGTTYRFEEIEKSFGDNKLANMVNSGYNYFKVAITRGAQSWTGYGAIGNFRSHGTKRRTTASWEFVPIQINAPGTTTSANPVYA